MDTKETKNKQFLYDVMVLHILKKSFTEQSLTLLQKIYPCNIKIKISI